MDMDTHFGGGGSVMLLVFAQILCDSVNTDYCGKPSGDLLSRNVPFITFRTTG